MWRSNIERDVWVYQTVDIFNKSIAMLEHYIGVFGYDSRYVKAIEVMKKFSRRRIYKDSEEVFVSVRVFTSEASALIESLLMCMAIRFEQEYPEHEYIDYTKDLKDFVVQEKNNSSDSNNVHTEEEAQISNHRPLTSGVTLEDMEQLSEAECLVRIEFLHEKASQIGKELAKLYSMIGDEYAGVYFENLLAERTVRKRVIYTKELDITTPKGFRLWLDAPKTQCFTFSPTPLHIEYPPREGIEDEDAMDTENEE